jgi:type IX secretion system substrate protein
MAVTLYMDAPSDLFINYPFFNLVFDENGNAIANGGLDFFGQFGGTSQIYTLQTTLDSLPAGFTASLSFEYNEQFCSLTYPCTTTSVLPLESLDMKIYPNPFSSEAVIQLDEPLSGGRVTLYDMQGQRVRIFTWTSGDQFSIKDHGLTPGPYFIQVSGPDKRAMGKCFIMD